MSTSILDNFALPDGAREDLEKQGYSMRRLRPGVEVIDGHDKGGVPYRFFRLVEKDEAKSKAAGFAVHRSEDCILKLKNRRMQTVERVRFLPEDLLKIHEDGSITGEYAENYKRYLKGQQAPGLSLAKWGELDDAAVADLGAMNIFTVEQFSTCPRDKFHRMGKVILDAHEAAIQWVRGQQGRFEAEKHAQRIVSLEGELSKNQDKIMELQKALEDITKRGRGRPKKKDKEQNNASL